MGALAQLCEISPRTQNEGAPVLAEHRGSPELRRVGAAKIEKQAVLNKSSFDDLFSRVDDLGSRLSDSKLEMTFKGSDDIEKYKHEKIKTIIKRESHDATGHHELFAMTESGKCIRFSRTQAGDTMHFGAELSHNKEGYKEPIRSNIAGRNITVADAQAYFKEVNNSMQRYSGGDCQDFTRKLENKFISHDQTADHDSDGSFM